MKTIVYNQQGKESGESLLPKEIFDVKLSFDLVHQIATSLMSNKRQNIAHTKSRGEVRGGGRKPWKQKGTGRARHGSNRSPIWRGGGITFGPRNDRNFKRVIPKKMNRKAIFMVLSSKLRDNELIVVNELKIDSPKTKDFSILIKGILQDRIGKTLIATETFDKNMAIAAKNIPNVKVIAVNELNVLDLLNFKYLIISEGSIKKIKNIFKLETKQGK
jgi:large subunit ribosomal protein L4